MTAWTRLDNVRSQARCQEYELAIREWSPGDGLTCSSAARQRKHPCGAPVAVVRKIWEPTWTRGYMRKEVLCSRHVGEFLRTYLGDQADVLHPQPLTDRAEREAREKVLAAHWDEYQDAQADILAAHEKALIEATPEALRKFLNVEGATR